MWYVRAPWSDVRAIPHELSPSGLHLCLIASATVSDTCNESIPYLVYLLTVFHCVFKSVPAVVCFVTSCHKYEGPLPFLRCLVCHKDHIHSLLEGPPCGNLVSCSPVHLWILLPWDQRHDFCN